MVLPRKLEGTHVPLCGSDHLRIIWSEDDKILELRAQGGDVDGALVVAILPKATRLGGKLLQNLRLLREVVIPDQTERIGMRWFYGCDIESVTIPDSVREIGEEAFRMCAKLKQVKLAEGGWLWKIGLNSFAQSGVEEIAIPRDVKLIDCGAFKQCRSLKRVTFSAKSRLGEIGDVCFSDSGLE